ncbi:hypothetical protein ACQ4M3_34050 [Leptolyngbya sp. AN03gr2]|uniref:hypothetical protein n=1 Tax=Leptolyngbya sp. AN03gr2 TaxID=3423364 RepID=UPI003D31DE85
MRTTPEKVWNMKKLQPVGFGLPAGLIDLLDSFAAEKSISRSEAARAAIELGLPLLKLGKSIDTTRILTILEYCQLSLSLIVQEEYPDDADHVMAQALSNAETRHG